MLYCKHKIGNPASGNKNLATTTLKKKLKKRNFHRGKKNKITIRARTSCKSISSTEDSRRTPPVLTQCLHVSADTVLRVIAHVASVCVLLACVCDAMRCDTQ